MIQLLIKLLLLLICLCYYNCYLLNSKSIRSEIIANVINDKINGETDKIPTNNNNKAIRNVNSIFKQSSRLLITGFSVLSLNLLAPTPSLALNSLESANNKLSSYGLPPLLFEPPGFSTIVSEYGRGNVREKMNNPIVVQFSYPQLWIPATTSININGEAGTISAGDYVRGDSAYFYTAPLKNGDKLSASNTDLIKRYIKKTISQKGDFVDTLVVGPAKEGVIGVDGRPYYIVNFSYEINTAAGFLVRRNAVISLTSIGDAIQSLTAVTTSQRYKKYANDLKDIANSFRVYKLNSGIFSAEK